MSRKKGELVEIVKTQSDNLIQKHRLPPSVRDSSYFTYGLITGLESLLQYINTYYSLKKKPTTLVRKKPWKTKRKTKPRKKGFGTK